MITSSLVQPPQWDEYNDSEELGIDREERPAAQPLGRIASLATRAVHAVAEGSKNFAIGAAVIIPFAAANLGQMYCSDRVTKDNMWASRWLRVADTHVFEMAIKYGRGIDVPLVKRYILLQEGYQIPMEEEGLYRRFIQDSLLLRVPRYFLQKMAPSTVPLLDSNAAKAFRIGVASLFFAYSHLRKLGCFDKEVERRIAINALGLGIICGVLKECKPGMMGALGAHVMNNLIAALPVLRSVDSVT